MECTYLPFCMEPMSRLLADIYILWTSFLPEKLAAPSKPTRFKANMLRMDSGGPLMLYNMLYIYLLYYSGGGRGGGGI